MARIEESRNRFLRWALWKQAGGVPDQDPEAAAVDRVIDQMPRPVKSAVVEVYLGTGQRAASGRRGCPETTIVRRLGQADRLLQDQLAVADEQRRQGTTSAMRVCRTRPIDE